MATERYVSALASSGTGTSVDPWTLAQMITALSDSAIDNGDRVNVKADGTYTSADVVMTRDAIPGNPIRIEGYTDTIGDTGKATIERASGTGTFWDFSGATNYIFKRIVWDINDVGSGTYGIRNHSGNIMINCEVKNAFAVTNSVNGGQWFNAYFYKCKSVTCNRGRYCLLDGVDKTQDGYKAGVLDKCIVRRAKIGFVAVAPPNDCIADDCATPLSTTAKWVISNMAFSNCTNGVNVAATGHTIMRNRNMFNCGADTVSGSAYFEDINPTALDPQYNDPDSNDFTRTGDNLNRVGFSGVGDRNIDYEQPLGIHSLVEDLPTIGNVRNNIDYDFSRLNGTLLTQPEPPRYIVHTKNQRRKVVVRD